MKAVKNVRCTHDCFIFFVVLLTICGCSVSRSKIKPGHQPSSVSKEPDALLSYTPITVFPLQNATGKPELNWLSIGLQESLTIDLLHISDLHTKAPLDFNRLIKKHCHGMTLSCVAGLSEATTDKFKMSDWQAIATAAKLEKFLWGSYQVQEDDITVHLHLYSGPKWTSQGEMTIKAPLSELLRESSQQLLPFLKAQGISIKPVESERIVSIKTESVTAWKHNAMGYWCQQVYLAAGEEQKKAIAEKCEGSFKKAVAVDSEYAGGWSNLGYQKILTGDLNGAVRAFRKALEKKPDMVNAHMGLGYCLAEKGELTNAISHLEKGVKLNPSLSDYYSYLMNTYAVLSKSTGEYDKAKNLYEHALAIDEKAYGQEHPKVAVRLSNLALLHHTMGEYSRAKVLYQRALAIDEKSYGQNHPDVAKDLNNLAGLYRILGEYDRAQSLYERALAIDQKAYGQEHPDVAKDLNNLAECYYVMGKYDKGKPLFERALTIYKKVAGPNQPEVATVLNNLALLYHAAGEYSKAKPLFERALSIDQKAYGQEHPNVAKDLSNLAGLYYATGEYGKAQSLYERALAIDEKHYGREHPDVAKDLSNLAGLYYVVGEYGRAKPLYERALAIDEKAYGQEHPDVAKDLNNLAGLYRILGEYGRAQSLYKRALKLCEKVYGADHPDVAIFLNNLAELHCDLGEYGKAEPLYERALYIYKKAHGPEHPDVAIVLNNLAGIYYASANYDKAKSFYERALAIDEKVYGNEHPTVSIRLNNLAEIYYIMDQYDRAQPLYERAMAVALTSGQLELLWRVQFNLGYLLDKQGNLPAAIFFGKRTVNTIQKLRAGVSRMGKGLQKSFLKTKWHAYKFLADRLIDEGRIPEAQQVLDMLKEEEYFDFIRRNVGKRDARTTTATYTQEEQHLSERYQEISSKIASLGKEFEKLKQKKKIGLTDKEMARYSQIDNDIKIARRAFNRYLTKAIADLSNATRERYAEVKERRLDKPRKLQQALRELGHGAVVIHYLITADKVRIILTTTEVQLARDVAISSKELNHKIMDYRTTLQNPLHSPLSQAQELYQIVFAPIEKDLKQAEAKTLMLSLDGTLRYLPVAALHDGTSYVVEHYRLAIYTAAAGLDIKDKPAEKWQIGSFGLSKAVLNLDPLPNVPAELESIVRRNKSDPDGVVPGVIYLNEAFSRKTLESVLTEEFPVLHIASHFQLKPGTEQSSHLVLGDGTSLSLAKIKEDDYDFRGIELITLSACNTAVGGTGTNGSEIESFGALVQDQGAKGVLATLWPVADKSTGIIMQNFYRLHEERPSITKADALHQVQLMCIQKKLSAVKDTQDKKRGMAVSSVREEGKQGFTLSDATTTYTHPFYWAPFILMGNWL